MWFLTLSFRHLFSASSLLWYFVVKLTHLISVKLTHSISWYHRILIQQVYAIFWDIKWGKGKWKWLNREKEIRERKREREYLVHGGTATQTALFQIACSPLKAALKSVGVCRMCRITCGLKWCASPCPPSLPMILRGRFSLRPQRK